MFNKNLLQFKKNLSIFQNLNSIFQFYLFKIIDFLNILSIFLQNFEITYLKISFYNNVKL